MSADSTIVQWSVVISHSSPQLFDRFSLLLSGFPGGIEYHCADNAGKPSYNSEREQAENVQQRPGCQRLVPDMGNPHGGSLRWGLRCRELRISRRVGLFDAIVMLGHRDRSAQPTKAPGIAVDLFTLGVSQSGFLTDATTQQDCETSENSDFHVNSGKLSGAELNGCPPFFSESHFTGQTPQSARWAPGVLS